MPCTTELVLDGMAIALSQVLADRWGAARRCYREAEWPAELQPEETPAIGLEEGDDRLVQAETMIEQDFTLHFRVKANEFTRGAELVDEADGKRVGPKVSALRNEAFAAVDTVLIDRGTVWNGVMVTVKVEADRVKSCNSEEAYGQVRGTLTFSRLAAEALGVA